MLKGYNVTSSQFKILLYLFKEDPKKEVKQIDLERLFLLSTPTMTGLIKRLEKNGFIKKEKSTKDGRSNVIILTEKAFSIKDELIDIAGKMEAAMTQGLTDSELETAYGLLNRFLLNII